MKSSHLIHFSASCNMTAQISSLLGKERLITQSNRAPLERGGTVDAAPWHTHVHFNCSNFDKNGFNGLHWRVFCMYPWQVSLFRHPWRRAVERNRSVWTPFRRIAVKSAATPNNPLRLGRHLMWWFPFNSCPSLCLHAVIQRRSNWNARRKHTHTHTYRERGIDGGESEGNTSCTNTCKNSITLSACN